MLLETAAFGDTTFSNMVFVVDFCTRTPLRARYMLGKHSTTGLHFWLLAGLHVLPGPGTARGWLQVRHFMAQQTSGPGIALKLVFIQGRASNEVPEAQGQIQSLLPSTELSGRKARSRPAL